jgi:RNA polymerase-binding transcription factor DksA
MIALDKMKNLLIKQQKQVEEDLKAIEADDPLMLEGPAESSEPGTDSWMADTHSRSVALKASLQDLLKKTKRALSDLNSGKYGNCVICGKMIEKERLEALLTASECISCSKKS